MPPQITREGILSEMDRLQKVSTAQIKGRLSATLREMNTGKLEEAVDIITYIRAGWGLDETPYPIQVFLLKIIYGLPLDEEQVLDYLPARAVDENSKERALSKDIIIWNKFRDQEVGRYTEVDFLEMLNAEGRCTLTYEQHLKRLGRKMNMVIMRMGRRGGKTTLSQWITAYEIYRLTRIYSPQDHYGTRKDQPVRITLVATSEDQARQLLAPARAAIQRAPILRQFLDLPDSQDQIRLNTQRNIDMGISASAAGIKVAANACSARSLRGPANIMVLLEEYGFFNSELKSSGRSSNKSDREIYKAVAPSTGDFRIPGTDHPDSMIMVVSTPQSKESHMYELETFIREGRIEDDAVAFWIPTYWINYSYPSSQFRREYLIDPLGFIQEYEAEYPDNVQSAFSEQALERCRVEPCGEYGVVQKGESTWMGVDLGLKNDGTTTSIVATNSTGESRLIHHEVIRMGLQGYADYVERNLSGDMMDYLSIEKIAKRIEFLWTYYGCQGGVYDQWNAYGLQSHLTGRCREALLHVEFNSTNNDRVARHALSVINQRRVIIYANIEDWKNEESLIWELAHLERIETAGAAPRIRLQATNIQGRHDDQYSSLSRALWAAKVGVEDNTPGMSSITPVHQRLAASLRARVEAARQARGQTHGRTIPNRGIRRF